MMRIMRSVVSESEIISVKMKLHSKTPAAAVCSLNRKLQHLLHKVVT